METKSIFASKTAWFGAVMAALGILQYLQAVDWASLLATHKTGAALVGIVIGAAVVGLRSVTGQPVSLTGK